MLKLDELDSVGNQNGFDILKQSLTGAISAETRTKIEGLVHEVACLKDIEKLLFCLLLPVDCGSTQNTLGLISENAEFSGNSFEFSTLGMGLFPACGPTSLHLSNQVEQSQAYTWIMSHLEEDSKTCLRKDEVYEDYRAYCDKHHMKTLNTADFGKVMKRAFPNVKPRRLGQRGQSRYCYGGMRKKTEIQPPFLPDLTDEALSGAASLTTLGRSTNSPASSSGASGGDGHQRQRLCSPVSLVRMLQMNGGSDSGASSDDVHLWSILGLRSGPVVADVAHLLLEYAQQVFGLQFHSLFHLAHHLVTNRYVNSRSRHALALIAHATNGPSLSPPPSAALAEALQKGMARSAFGRVGNGRAKANALQRTSHVKSEDDLQEASPTPNRFPRTEGHSPHISTPTAASGGQAHTNLQSLIDSRTNPAAQRSFHGTSPFSLSADLSAVQHLPTCSTPQPLSSNSGAAAYQHRSAGYQSNFSPQTVPATTTTSCSSTSAYSATALASPAAGVVSPTVSHYQHVFNASNSPGGILRHSTATLAAAAAVHRQQQYLSSLPDYSSYNNRQVALPVASNPQHMITSPILRNPNSSSKDKSAVGGFPLVSNEAGVGYSGYHQQHYQHQVKQQSHPTNPPAYAAHQQTASPYQYSQQPPVPLPPGVTARSAYTPVGQPPVGCVTGTHHQQQQQHNTPPSSSSGSYKRAPPNPVDAPGAYEPSPRFHLGGQSPTKRTRYLSAHTTMSGSSGCSLPEFPPLGMAEGCSSSLSEQQHRMPHLREPSGEKPGNSVAANNASTTAKPDYCATTLNCSQRISGPIAQSPLPHYFQHSAGYEVGRTESGPALTGHTWSVSQQQSANDSLSTQQESVNFCGIDQLSRRNYLVSSEEASGMFLPPITPFSLKMDECDEVTNLPRLGSSPGPKIPPSSPTEFLPFYSEAASKAKQQNLSTTTAVTPSHHATSSDGEEQHLSGDSCTGVRTDNNVSLETPPSSTRQDRVRTNSLSSTDSESSRNRTLTRLDPVTTPPMPGGLASVPSPSEPGQLQHRAELRTPSPVDHQHSLNLEQETSSTGSCPSSTEVRAF